MFDLLVNGQVVAIVAKDLVKPFINTLVSMLPVEMSVSSKQHVNPGDAKVKEPDETKKDA